MAIASPESGSPVEMRGRRRSWGTGLREGARSEELRLTLPLTCADECMLKYGNPSVWKACCQVFDHLNLAAVGDRPAASLHHARSQRPLTPLRSSTRLSSVFTVVSRQIYGHWTRSASYHEHKKSRTKVHSAILCGRIRTMWRAGRGRSRQEEQDGFLEPK